MTEDSSATVTETGLRWQGLAAVADGAREALVLGSFPGLKSLQLAQYYAHPQNQFWPLLQALWPRHPQPPRADYAGRCEWLLERGLGLWDVYASCEREGSLDSAIRAPRSTTLPGCASAARICSWHCTTAARATSMPARPRRWG
jgi:hypoxanthine-DNA glycosylase